MRVPTRQLGADGPEVSALSFGSWHTWDRMEFDAAVEFARTAVDAGLTFFDVGYYNVGPHPEGSDTDIIFGKAMTAAGIGRNDYTLCCKLWMWEYPQQSFAYQLDNALNRIGTDYADVVLLGDFFGDLDLERVVTDLAELARAGRISHWGFNNWAADDVHTAHAFAVREGMPTPKMAQLKYSLCRRAIPEGQPYESVFRDLGVALQASDVFEGGILVGNLNPDRRIGIDPGDIRERIRAAVPIVAAIAAEFSATPAQLAIAFCLTHPAAATVLFGGSRAEQLVDNLGAIELADKHGAQIRERVAELWLDRGIVSPDASWGVAKGQLPPGLPGR